MKMIFIGATHEVTGSCTYLEVCGKRILVDFGMEQGRDTYENVKIPCAPGEIDYVLLTHAHIDHSGLLPLLYAGGFSGKSTLLRQRLLSVKSCCVTVRISKNLRQNGETARRCEKAANRMCLCIP